MQGEPRDRGALGDTAVRDRRLVAVDPVVGVQLLQLLDSLERAVVVGDSGPRDVLRAGDVAATLGGLLQARRREDLAGELLGRPYVDQRDATLDGVVDVLAARMLSRGPEASYSTAENSGTSSVSG